MLTQINPLVSSDRKNFEIAKIQDGVGRHFESLKNHHISAMSVNILSLLH